MNKISNQPPKGTSDWTPEEFRVRKYIFDTWRSVCLKFGYQEYLTPIVENAEVYRAKSGEDVGGKELMSFFDRGERELAIRPEMTPSVTRMVSKIYESAPKPIRLFSIANFFRNEKPQRGRNREFWQLNCDIFGSESISADIEVAILSIEIMKSFGATSDQFKLRFNERNIARQSISQRLEIEADKVDIAMKLTDKFRKMDRDEFKKSIAEATGSNPVIIDNYIDFISNPNLSEIEDYSGIGAYFSQLSELGYSDYIQYDPSLVRGLDYYDGIVFEVYDTNPENSRSLFGGGRYNGLASIFGSKSFPAVGFAPGDETTKLFLESWNLIPQNLKEEVYFLPLLSNELLVEANNLARKLRSNGKNIMMGLEIQTISKALEVANKKGCDKVILFGDDEKSRGEYVIKDMQSGEQKVFQLPI